VVNVDLGCTAAHSDNQSWAGKDLSSWLAGEVQYSALQAVLRLQVR
jgi:hypothetical protein